MKVALGRRGMAAYRTFLDAQVAKSEGLGVLKPTAST